MSTYPIYDEAEKEANKNDIHNLALFGRRIIQGLQWVSWPEDVEELVFNELDEFLNRAKGKEQNRK